MAAPTPTTIDGQVIGAAAKETAPMGFAGAAAAAAPRLQDSAWRYARTGAAQARVGLLEVTTYVQETRCSVRVCCFCAAVVLLISSVLGMINIFKAGFHPIHYLLAFYNVLFSGVIIVMDGKPEWFAQCWDVQSKLYSSATFLAWQGGRAAFYFYVGSINLAMLPDGWLWKVIYVAVGSVLCGVGLLLMLDRCGVFGYCPSSSRAPSSGAGESAC